MTKCCSGNDSPNFSQRSAASPASKSADPLLVSISTLLQSHNGQMILERSPQSPKLLNSEINHSLARATSHKKWATKKLNSLGEPVTLQRMSRSGTTKLEPTESAKEQACPEQTNPIQVSLAKPICNPTMPIASTFYVPNEIAPTLGPKPSSCTPHTNVMKRLPATNSNSMKRVKRTDSNIIIPSEHKRVWQYKPPEPTTEPMYQPPLIPRLDCEPQSTNCTAWWNISSDTPTKAHLSIMNYGLPRDHEKTQHNTQYKPKLAPDSLTINDQRPISVAEGQWITNPNLLYGSNFALPTSTFNSSEQLLTSPALDGQYTKPNLSNAQHTQLVLPTSAPNGDRDDIQPPPHPVHAIRVLELGKDLATPLSHPTTTQSWMELDEYETVRSKPESNPGTFGPDMDIDIA